MATSHTGPFVVLASNFAQGTTAADIEAAMIPVGGEVLQCRILSARPTVLCEIVFRELEGAENVIATFNNQKVCLGIAGCPSEQETKMWELTRNVLDRPTDVSSTYT